MKETKNFKRLMTFAIAMTLCLTALAIVPTVSAATEYYVSTTGDNANTGLSWAEAWRDIQYAVDNVGSGDTVHVAAGTYNENIIIDKSLTVVSVEGSEVTIINAQVLGFGVLIHGTGTVVTFDGFTVENYKRVGILAGSFSLAEEDPDVVHILNNIVKEPIGQQNNNCIQIGDGTTGTVIGNEVMGASLESPDWTGSGILVAGSSNVVISNNYAHDCESGIVIVGYAEYRDAPAINNLIEDNLVEDSGTGISVQMYSIGTIIRYNNVLNNNGGIAVMAIDYSWEHSTPSCTEIHFNNIVGNVNYGVKSGLWGSDTGEVLAEEINATYNWWGHATGADHISNPHGTGQGGDAVTDNVGFIPWYATSTTTSSTEYVTVNHNPIIAVSDTIQGGIDAALDGDIINVAAGTYNENVVVDKSVDLVGENKETTIIQKDVNRLIQINSEDVVITGFSILGSMVNVGHVTSAIFFDENSGLTIEDNIIEGWCGIVLNGPSGEDVDVTMTIKDNYIKANLRGIMQLVPQTSTNPLNLLIEGNTIKCGDNPDHTVSGGIYIQGLKNSIIQDNIIRGFIGPSGRGISGSENDNIIISGNTLDGSATYGIAMWVVTNIKIDGNTITNNKRAGINIKGQNIDIINNDIKENGFGGSKYNVGVYIAEFSIPTQNVNVNCNIIEDNAAGLTNVAPIEINAEYNWWGHCSGPIHSGNPSGLGNAVSDNVDYDPWAGKVIGPTDPVPLVDGSATVSLTGYFTCNMDTATFDWGDGSSLESTDLSPSDTSITGSHTYTEAGVYTVTLTIDDDNSWSITMKFQYVVVYDPDAGFVTGGGWINSPIGAYRDDPSLTGKANFGFVSKYKKGQSTPTGNTQFQFKAGGLNFHSSEYDWMVLAGAKAMYKGTGTINNAGTYKFIITAGDGQISRGTDTFRIKIWYEDNGNEIIVYDNGTDTPLGGGQIKIHQK